MEISPSKKNTSRVATSVASKAKSTADRGARPTNSDPPHLDVLIEDAKEGQYSPPTDLREEENGHEAQLFSKGQLLQMLKQSPEVDGRAAGGSES